MHCNNFKGLQLSALGFGTMRLPVAADGEIDKSKTQEMVDALLLGGCNYFDLAYPYMDGKSETVIGECLRGKDRSAFYLADKYPGHQHFMPLSPEEVFEEQLKKVGTDYFDFYLLHNVNDSCYDHYTDEEYGIVRYFAEQKKKGRIRHLGFSSHASEDCFERFLSWCEEKGYEMEFCQIELNYLDWTLQDAAAKVKILNEKNIPIWVMEPVRGGKLASFSEKDAAVMEAFEKGKSAASWALRWAAFVPGVVVTLSGMSNMTQVQDNLATFSSLSPLSGEEEKALFAIAEGMKDDIPCTACRYCVKACPQGINIPLMMRLENEICFQATFQPGMIVAGLPDGQKPWDCLQCGTCAVNCPQGIDIPEVLSDLTARLKAAPDWVEICREREEIRRKSIG